MADIKPFKAWRYNSEKIADASKEFAPLFEVVGQTQLDALYQRPYNAIHLSMPQSHPEAAAKLTAWKQAAILQQDDAPALFAYYQQFTLFGVPQPFVRKGFIGMLRLREEDIILHEGVIPQAVAERARLLGSLKMQVVPTHGLYQDEQFELETILDRHMAKPMYSFLDQQGVVNKLSPITDSNEIAHIQSFLKEKKIYLADGHHRLAGSYAYRKQRSRKEALNSEHPANFHFTYLSNLAGQDLRILPTHRIWQPAIKPDIPELKQNIEHWFELTDVSRSRKPLFDLLKNQPRTFGMASLGRRWLMKLRDDIDPLKEINLDLPDAVKTLDYTILHYLIFDHVLGLPYDEQRSSPEIAYEKDYSAAIAAVNKGHAALSFIAQEVSIQQFLEVCGSGAKMPQKSTYFYPKVNCGMVFAEM